MLGIDSISPDLLKYGIYIGKRALHFKRLHISTGGKQKDTRKERNGFLLPFKNNLHDDKKSNLNIEVPVNSQHINMNHWPRKV